MTEPDAPVVSPPPSRRTRRGRFWAVAVLAAVALAGGSVVAITGYASQDGPDAVVRSYFAALDRGDAEGALGYGDVPAGDRAYLTADVLRDQLAIAPITSLRTAPAARGQVMISYFIAGKRITDAVPMIKRDGRWRLASSAIRVSVSLSAAGQRATFAGTAVPTDQPLLFPGALPVRFDNPNLSVPPSAAVPRFNGSPGSGNLTVDVSPAGKRAVSAAIIAALTTCVTSTDRSPLCPTPAGTGIRAVPASLRATITGTPVVETTVAPQADGQLLISGSAKLTGSYESLDYENQAKTVTGPVDINFKAHCYANDPAKFVWDAS
jgi:hypothetical protein